MVSGGEGWAGCAGIPLGRTLSDASLKLNVLVWSVTVRADCFQADTIGVMKEDANCLGHPRKMVMPRLFVNHPNESEH